MKFNFFRRKNHSETYIPSLSDITFKQLNLEFHCQDEHQISWYTNSRAALTLKLLPAYPWDFYCHELDKAEPYWQQQTQQINGSLIELNYLEIQKIPALQGIFKYRSPEPNSLAMYYVGIIWLPFKHFLYQINCEAVEKGDTGIREATVALLLDKETPAQLKEQDEPEIISMNELFEKLSQSKITRTPADQSKYDDLFPDHPLTQVRCFLNELPNHIQLTDTLLQQPIYEPAKK